MAKIPIEKGTIKVVWIEKDLKRIYSKMFENIGEAIKFGKSKSDFLIFRLLSHKDYRDYQWELLPYGHYKLYQALLENYQKYKGSILSLIEKKLSKILL